MLVTSSTYVCCCKVRACDSIYVCSLSYSEGVTAFVTAFCRVEVSVASAARAPCHRVVIWPMG